MNMYRDGVYAAIFASVLVFGANAGTQLYPAVDTDTAIYYGANDWTFTLRSLGGMPTRGAMCGSLMTRIRLHTVGYRAFAD